MTSSRCGGSALTRPASASRTRACLASVFSLFVRAMAWGQSLMFAVWPHWAARDSLGSMTFALHLRKSVIVVVTTWILEQRPQDRYMRVRQVIVPYAFPPVRAPLLVQSASIVLL